MRYKYSYIVLLIVFLILDCHEIKKILIQKLGATEKYENEGNANNLIPVFSGLDEKREKIQISLREVASGFVQPTDLQFPPAESNEFFVLEKKDKILFGSDSSGNVYVVDIGKGKILKIERNAKEDL